MTEQEFLKKMDEAYRKLKHNPEMHTHRIDYLSKEIARLASNEKKLWKGCDELDKRIEELEKILKSFVKPKPEFMVGDRIRAYDENSIFEGEIVKINDDILFIEDCDWRGKFHKKQCRRLKKKEK